MNIDYFLSEETRIEIYKQLDSRGFATVDIGLASSVEAARREFEALFDLPSQESFDLKNGDFEEVCVKKLSGKSGSPAGYHESFTGIYLPRKSNPAIENLQQIVKKVSAFQDQFFRVESKISFHEKHWVAPRFHLYLPGDYIGEHPDTHYLRGLQEFERPMVRIAWPISARGETFDSGGFYLINDGQKIYPEEVIRPGEVLIFDGNKVHGVSDVLSEQERPLTYRAQLFVNYYAKIQKEDLIAGKCTFTDSWVQVYP